MVKIIFSLPLKYLFWLVGETGESRQQSAFPILMPYSFEYQYFGIADCIPTKGLDLNDENIKAIRDKTKTSLESSIKVLKEERLEDPDRESPNSRIAAIAFTLMGGMLGFAAHSLCLKLLLLF